MESRVRLQGNKEIGLGPNVNTHTPTPRSVLVSHPWCALKKETSPPFFFSRLEVTLRAPAVLWVHWTFATVFWYLGLVSPFCG